MTGTVALVVAAGRGHRFGGPLPKQYQQLGGVPLLRHCLRRLAAHPRIDAVRVVIHPDDRPLYDEAAAGLDLLAPCAGGGERQESVRLGLESLKTLEGGRAVPVFPNAEVIVQKQEWDDALANRSTMHATYLRDHLDPIAERVRTVEGDAEALPGLRVRPVPGHTFGQQAVLFEAPGGETVAFPGDLMPTRHHAPTTWGMAYDVESYTTMVEKARFLADAHERAWTIVLDHDPGEPVMRTQPNEKREGEFTLIEAR